MAFKRPRRHPAYNQLIFATRPYRKYQLIIKLLWNAPEHWLSREDLSRQLESHNSTGAIPKPYWVEIARHFQPGWRLWNTPKRVGLLAPGEPPPAWYLSEVLAPKRFQVYDLIRKQPGIDQKALAKITGTTTTTVRYHVWAIRRDLRYYGLTITTESGYWLTRCEERAHGAPE